MRETKRYLKRFLSAFLVVAVLACLMPASVSAKAKAPEPVDYKKIAANGRLKVTADPERVVVAGEGFPYNANIYYRVADSKGKFGKWYLLNTVTSSFRVNQVPGDFIGYGQYGVFEKKVKAGTKVEVWFRSFSYEDMTVEAKYNKKSCVTVKVKKRINEKGAEDGLNLYVPSMSEDANYGLSETSFTNVVSNLNENIRWRTQTEYSAYIAVDDRAGIKADAFDRNKYIEGICGKICNENRFYLIEKSVFDGNKPEAAEEIDITGHGVMKSKAVKKKAASIAKSVEKLQTDDVKFVLRFIPNLWMDVYSDLKNDKDFTNYVKKAKSSDGYGYPFFNNVIQYDGLAKVGEASFNGKEYYLVTSICDLYYVSNSAPDNGWGKIGYVAKNNINTKDYDRVIKEAKDFLRQFDVKAVLVKGTDYESVDLANAEAVECTIY